jgi:hypothetical protein
MLLCFGFLSLQAGPVRVCYLEKDSQPVSHVQTDCCEGCSSHSVAIIAPGHTDCCVDFQTLPDTISQAQLDLRVAPARILCLIETVWMAPPALAKREAFPPLEVTHPPLTAAERQAALSIWTV